MSRLLVALVALAALAAPSAAHAQARFDPQFFRPTTSQRTNPMGTWSANVLHDGAFNVGLLGHYDHEPLVVRNEDGDVIYPIVGHQASLHVFGAFGLFEYLEIGADLPIILSQQGDAIPTLPGFNVGAPTAGAGIGDVRLTAKLRFFETNTEDSPGGAAMALVVDGLFPTGEQELYQGDDFRIAPRLVVDGITDTQHRVSFNVGFTYRQETALANLEVGSTFDWGVAVTFVSEYVHVVPEVRGSLVMTASDIGFEEVPMEADLGLRFLPIEPLQIQLGGGVGLFQGFGAPVFRAMLSASWMQVPPTDRDGDGILNDDDQCPDDPEDADEFEDDDGCPDPDNDGDGILDEPDQCPNEPEDQNGVQDEDGCPEVDSDGDGFLDPVDQCPQEPEDVDQFEDEDGCPDPDNDGDGILDGPDQCPNEPEVINGVDDQDGCPDESAITVTCDSIEIRDQIYFETDRDVIRSVSFGLLDQIAAVIQARSDIRRVSIEGHTDDRGSDDHNLELSQRRAAAVVEYLVQRGIDRGRLVSSGFGETRPIDSNRTRAGRANNRRVEFRIVEQEGCRDEAGAGPAVP